MTGLQYPFKRSLTMSVVAVVASAGWLIYDGTRTSHPPQPVGSDAFQAAPASPSAEESSAPPVPAASSGVPVPAMLSSVPTRIRIPSIRVDAPVIRVGLDSTEHLETPPETNRNLVGWYSDGTTPGAAGNAVMDGHVDTRRGPAVFYNLGALRKQDTIEVDRLDGTVAVFAIDAIEVYSKKAFPDQKVYGPSRDPELHLITCGGSYSRRSGYRANVVVYAHLVRSRPGG